MSSTTDQVPRLAIRGDTEIPQLGFGVFQVPPEDTADVVSRAFATRYRHIDTPAAYRNEEGGGQAIRASVLGRDEVFVTTKCPNPAHGYDAARQALAGSPGGPGLAFFAPSLTPFPS